MKPGLITPSEKRDGKKRSPSKFFPSIKTFKKYIAERVIPQKRAEKMKFFMIFLLSETFFIKRNIRNIFEKGDIKL